MKGLLFRRCELDRTSCNGFKYPKEGWVEAEDYNTEKECGGGLHALRVGDDLDFLDPEIEEEGLWQVFTDYEDLIDLGNKAKIRKGFVKTGIDITEYRDEFLKDPYWAYWYALDIDKCARDDTRRAACGDSHCAYMYALDVDKCARDDTREAACRGPYAAYQYALEVDECARDDTRKAACGDPRWAYRYALYVDKCTREDTREAACGNPEYAYWYALHVDKCAREDTREAACGNPEYAYWYALHVDKCAREDTREAACGNPYWKAKYQRLEKDFQRSEDYKMKELLFRRCELDRTSRNGFKYPKEGWVEAEDYSTKKECRGGLHALRVGDCHVFLNPSIEKKGLWQVFTDYEGLIDLGGKVKIRKGFVKTGVDITEYRDEILKDPYWAYWYAAQVDKYPSDETRKAACKDPEFACWYASDVDKCAREDTRQAACGDPFWQKVYQEWEESLSKKRGYRNETDII